MRLWGGALHPRRRVDRWLAGLLVALVLSCQALMAAEPIAIGQQIYRTGVGQHPVEATTQQDVRIAGYAARCAACHRRSGYGESEGGSYVPPITGPILFAPSKNDRAQRFKRMFMEEQPKAFYIKMRTPQLRPAYTDESLALAIRTGIDPTGRVLDPLMPRYSLSPAEMRALIAYLKTLSASPSPGVDDKNIHFSVIVSEDNTDSVARDAMISVLNAYVAWKNRDNGHWTEANRRSLLYRDQFVGSYRQWVLDTWTLKGAPDTWRAQLDTYYRARPVFAVLTGLVSGSWKPVHDFCESNEVPCVFPNTVLPVAEGPNVYSIYFSKGLFLEANVMASYLNQLQAAGKPVHVAQLYAKGDDESALPATELAAVKGLPPSESQTFSDDASLHAALEDIASNRTIDTLVIWPGNRVNSVLTGLASMRRLPDRIFLPSTVVDRTLAAAPAALRARLHFTYPYVLPNAYSARTYRVEGWLRSRGLAVTDARIQFDTYFVLEDAASALSHIINNYCRDYFVEYIEHETEADLNAYVYPRLSLGPEQRFASKGAYVVHANSESRSSLQAESEWIVP